MRDGRFLLPWRQERPRRGDPPDGALVRLDVSTAHGQVFVEPGAPTLEDWDGPTPPSMSPDQQAQIELLLRTYNGVIPHGRPGDQQLRTEFRTDVLHLSDGSVRRDLTVDEVNELSRYAGWNMWDCLAARATEGESGLIPRQEYESFSFVQIWQRYPALFRLITEAVGVDGLIEIGSRARHEVGTKINLVHLWALGFAPALGRGVSIGLGVCDPDERGQDLADTFQFQRRLYRGLWGADGADMFCTMRDYAAPILDPEWIERFSREARIFADEAERSTFQRFNPGTEMLGFLLHFDNRIGLGDTGPYPLPDGGFMIVRDHFLHEDAYQWGIFTENLPYAVTLAMVFRPDEPIDLQLLDIGTLFSEPANYLKHLKGAAVYARDRWDTPPGEIRLLSDADRACIQTECDAATARLYRYIASMSTREKIMAGAKVYYTDFILPVARAAGIWERLKEQFDFFELDPVASSSYYRLVSEGLATELVPRLVITGQGYPPIASPGALDVPDLSVAAQALFRTVSLRGMCAEVPELVATELGDLLTAARSGWMLSEHGRLVKQELLARERRAIDRSAFEATYTRFLPLNSAIKKEFSAWPDADEVEQELLARIDRYARRACALISTWSEQLPRFAEYQGRLEAALAAADKDHAFVLSPRCESVHTVWMELHEDLMQLQDIDRATEGSF